MTASLATEANKIDRFTIVVYSDDGTVPVVVPR